jgi:hypothetical protein
MSCRYAKGDVCLILINNGKCFMRYDQNEESCSNRDDGLIHYLKHLGTYDKMVKNNSEYLANKAQLPKHEAFIMDRFTKQN